MNPKDYPGAENAVELHESLKCWDMYVKTAKAEGVENLIERLRGSATAAMNSGDPKRHEVLRVALSEFDHPNFLAYIIDKIRIHRSK